ncbi:MAG: glutathione S-transferase N-terminal domain-containing protein [Candidatus Nealsonbacteria bacterium DGGOD1a]|jgi:glutaredoxin-like YruB-family protein|nr:MAG: glutathione S-transferase N-terminal domain-containing protein [Candidatus Nealsonbacteria bacterium DGGOD1a]
MIKIYSTPFCPYCSTLKDYLKEKKVEFTDVDVSENEKERDEMIELSGQIGVPVVNVDGKIIVGFDKEQIDEVLKLK